MNRNHLEMEVKFYLNDSASFEQRLRSIGASLIQGTQMRGLASLPGIVGGQYRKAQAFDYAQVNGNLLILYSDGLQSRWNLQDYPGLVHRHPAVIAISERARALFS